MKSFIIEYKENLELILTNLEGIWENNRDDSTMGAACPNCEDIDSALSDLNPLLDSWRESATIHFSSFANFGADFVQAAIENAMEDSHWIDQETDWIE